jgi:hypothetical protein
VLQVARKEGSSFEEHLQTLPKKNRNRLAAALLAKVRRGRGAKAHQHPSASVANMDDTVGSVGAVVGYHIG